MTDTPPALHVDIDEALAKLGVPVPQEIEMEAENKNLGIDVVYSAGEPGQVLLTGGQTLSEWRNGADNTKIDGSVISDKAWYERDPADLISVGEVTKATGNPKDAIGDTKPDISLVPAAGILLEAQAMMDGARKYGPYNWRENPVRLRVYVAAAMRHLQQYLDGEDIDPTSGVFHIGHARACLGILADATTVGNIIDDRPLPGKAGELIRRFGETKSFKPE